MIAFSQAAPPAQSGLHLLLQRASVSPRHLTEPAPAGAALDQILRAAGRAPDHGRLRPWRFIIIDGKRRIALGEVFARARQARDSEATAADLNRERRKPLRAPMVVAVGAAISDDHPGVRERDQLLAAACAAHGLLLAAQALGFGGIWLTGTSCYDTTVKRAFGLNERDSLLGYLYLGTPLQRPADGPRPTAWAQARRWHPDDAATPVESACPAQQ